MTASSIVGSASSRRPRSARSADWCFSDAARPGRNAPGPAAARRGFCGYDEDGGEQVVEGGITVVYDGVVGPWAVPAFLDGTALDRLHYAVLMPTEVCCTRRFRERSGHGFSDILVRTARTASGHISMLAARRPTIDAADT
jgi:hypothetical protein